MEHADRTRTTYRLELRRAISNGILEAAGSTFLLLIAVRHFHAGALAKSFIAAGGSAGLLLTPLVVSQVSRLGWPAALAASRLYFLGAICLAGVAFLPFEWVYIVGSVVSMAAASSSVPLLTQIYQENYPAHQRGRLFSRSVMVRIASVSLFSELAARALGGDIGRFRWLLLFFAGAFSLGAYWLRQYPSRPLDPSGGAHPFRAMRYLKEDRLFRYTLICWMLMGFANLMMLPLRVEYLANPKYGLSLDIRSVALLTGVIPNIARLLVSPLWGRLFDRANFFVLRAVLNVGFAVGILTFFLNDSWPMLVVGAIIFGISSAGGDVAWGLWVTKFAPSDRVADYMSVHTFLTGCRGVIAPVAAFQIIGVQSIAWMGGCCAGLILMSSLMLLVERRDPRASGRASPLSEEVGE